MVANQELLKSLFYYEDGQLIRKTSTMGNGNIAGKAIGTKPTKSRNFRYSTTKINGKHWCVHKLIYMYHYNNCPVQLDHINGDTTDNRIENLRPATATQNMCNRKLFVNSTSKCKGVSWSKRANKWFVYIDTNKRRKNVGYFQDFELAELVSMEARDLYHGNYANFN
jgi:hypothetical protein